jgi:hypothetical protein
MSEYMRNLDKRRREQIERDVMFLDEAMKKAPPGDPSDQQIADLYRRIRKRRNKKR